MYALSSWILWHSWDFELYFPYIKIVAVTRTLKKNRVRMFSCNFQDNLNRNEFMLHYRKKLAFFAGRQRAGTEDELHVTEAAGRDIIELLIYCLE